ncbi:MAG: ATP-binding protein [Acidimicrobiia bacterium]
MRTRRSSGTATVLFTDLVGSTKLLTTLGEAAFDEFRQQHFATLRDAVERHGGEEIKTLGDGILAVFGAAADALTGAVSMQQTVELQARTAPHPVSIRIGLALGDVAFEEGDVFGAPVVEAARLVAQARGGQILASDLVRVVAGGRCSLSFTELGPVVLKGLPEPLSVCEVAWEPISGPRVPVPPLLDEVGRIFVGREPELERLGRLWRESEAGELRVALLAGEPGVGKTRLASEIGKRVHAEGDVVLAGRCDEDLGVPFQPFVEALRHFVDHVPDDELPGCLGRFAGELVRLVPDLAQRAPELPSPVEADPETERYRLFDAVAAWLAAACAERPLLLVLDDLQWAAKPTLLLLRHLLHPRRALRLLVLATYRDTELRHDHPLAAVLADMRRQDGVERFSLTGLDVNDVRAFMAETAGHPLHDEDLALARAIQEETEGNPFFVREVLRHLTETGAVEPSTGRWVADRSLAELGIPEGVREVVGRRLSGLSSEANRILQSAAVIGPEFEVAVLAAAASFAEDALVGTLEEAVTSRLVVEVPGRAPRYRFSHALVRETLYEAITAARRVAVHRRVAAAIEAVHCDDLDDHLPALAHHWARAASPDAGAKAVAYATRAGARALAQLAHDEAARYYRQAIDAQEAFGLPYEPGRQVELLIALGEAQRRAGDPGHRGTLLEAARLAQAHGDADALGRAALANGRGFTWSTSGGIDTERVGALEAALEATGPGDSPLRARLLANLGLELLYSNDPERRRHLSDEALAVARRVGDPAVLAPVLLSRFVTIWHASTLAERRANAHETLAVAEQLGDPLTRSWACYRCCVTAMEAGDAAEADGFRERYEELTDDLGQPTLRWIALLNRTSSSLMRGRVEEAERLAFAGLETGEATGQADARLWWVVHLFNIRFDQGRLEEIESTFLETVQHYAAFPVLHQLLAVLYCELDRVDEARRLFDDLAAGRFTDIPQDVNWITTVVAAASTCAYLGDRERAAVFYRLLAPYGEHIVNPPHFCLGSGAHFLGLLAATMGRFDEAELHFAAAEKAHDGMQAPGWTAKTRLAWARILLTRGRQEDHERAQLLLRAALDVARDFGFGAIERQAVSLLGMTT